MCFLACFESCKRKYESCKNKTQVKPADVPEVPKHKKGPTMVSFDFDNLRDMKAQLATLEGGQDKKLQPYLGNLPCKK